MKRTGYLTSFSHDHHHGLQAAVALGRGFAGEMTCGQITEFVAALWRDHLEWHFEDEVRLLLPHMVSVASRTLGDRMLNEHRQIRSMVNRIAADSEYRSSVAIEFASMLITHIRFEERVLFPQLESEIPETELQKIADELARTKNQEPKQPPHTFPRSRRRTVPRSRGGEA